MNTFAFARNTALVCALGLGLSGTALAGGVRVNNGTLIGGVGGAVVGGVVTNSVGGAVVGGVAGAVVGTVIDDKNHRRKYRSNCYYSQRYERRVCR